MKRAKVLANKAQPRELRVEALKWVVHLAGDLRAAALRGSRHRKPSLQFARMLSDNVASTADAHGDIADVSHAAQYSANDGLVRGPARFTLLSSLIAVVFFVGVAPTLSWLEFSSGSENLVVATVLEMRRGGPWLIPTLKGEPRTAKPPLPTWITAIFVRPSQVQALSDIAERDAAYRRLAWTVRCPALAMACLTLVAAAWLGRVVAGSDRVGFATAAIMGSTLLFLRFGRSMTTDVHLALWVTTANALFASLLLRRPRHPFMICVAGGAAVGLALMSKGPVALVQTVVPMAVFIAWRRWRGGGVSGRPIQWWAIGAAVTLALLIALPWPIWVATRTSGQLAAWYREVTRVGATEMAPDPPWVYLALVPLLLPWAGFLFLGSALLWQERSARAVLLASMVLAPIVVMLFFKDKNDRYLQPMLAPAALICALGLVPRNDAKEKDVEPWRRLMAQLTFAMLAVTVVGLALVGATPLVQRLHGAGGWWSWRLAAGTSVAGLLIILAAWRADSTGRRTLLPAGVILMIGVQALLTYGYRDSRRGRSDGRPIADAIVRALPPDAPVWHYAPSGRLADSPTDATIYLNRMVTRTDALAYVTASGRPSAVMVHAAVGQSLPPELAGWREIGAAEKNHGVWHVCVSPGS